MSSVTEASRRAWLGLGGNLGDVRYSMIEVLDWLDQRDGITVNSVSSLYETPPWGITDQPVFLNACAELATSLAPPELLSACLEGERLLKRVRNERWGPRTIDLDILAMEGVELQTPELVIPHPRISERAFVLMPLCDLAPLLELNGRSAASWLELCDTTGVKKIANAADWWRQESRA